MMVGLTIIAFLVWIISGVVLRISTNKSNIPISYKFHREDVNILTKFTLPVLASGILPVIVFWYVKALMVGFPNGYEQVGIYTASEQWLIILAFIPGQMTNVSQPILANIYGTGSNHTFYKAVIGNIVFPVAIAIFIGIGIAFVARWIPGLYGNNFSGLNDVIVLMCIVGILRVIGGTFGVYLATINKMWLSFGIKYTMGRNFDNCNALSFRQRSTRISDISDISVWISIIIVPSNIGILLYKRHEVHTL